MIQLSTIAVNRSTRKSLLTFNENRKSYPWIDWWLPCSRVERGWVIQQLRKEAYFGRQKKFWVNLFLLELHFSHDWNISKVSLSSSKWCLHHSYEINVGEKSWFLRVMLCTSTINTKVSRSSFQNFSPSLSSLLRLNLFCFSKIRPEQWEFHQLLKWGSLLLPFHWVLTIVLLRVHNPLLRFFISAGEGPSRCP